MYRSAETALAAVNDLRFSQFVHHAARLHSGPRLHGAIHTSPCTSSAIVCTAMQPASQIAEEELEQPAD